MTAWNAIHIKQEAVREKAASIQSSAKPVVGVRSFFSDAKITPPITPQGQSKRKKLCGRVIHQGAERGERAVIEM